MVTKSAPKLLVDHRIVPLHLVEDKTPPTPGVIRRVQVEGEFADTNKPTANKRRYSRAVMESQVARLDAALKNRQVLGEIDHPADGRTMLQRVSHVITGLTLGEDGIVRGRAEILDTQRGKDLQALLAAGCKIGVSSRGFGSTVPNSEGIEEVQADYNLQTFDFVVDPADQNAYPEVVFEGLEFMPTNPLVETLPVAKAAEVKIEAVTLDRERLTAQLREQFAQELLTKTQEMRASLREEVQQELLSDPMVAGAVTALRKIKDAVRPFVVTDDVSTAIGAKDLELEAQRQSYEDRLVERTKVIEALQTANAELETKAIKYAQVAREAGYNFFLERTLGQDQDGALIRKVIGDVMQYANIDSLKERIEGVKEELAKYRAEDLKRQEAKQVEEAKAQAIRDEERQRAANEVAQLRAKTEEMVGALERTLAATKGLKEENDQLKAQLYAEQRLAQIPSASPRMKALITQSKAKSEDEVDKLLSENRETPVVSDSHLADSTRQRLRLANSGGGRTPSALDEERRNPTTQEPTRAVNGGAVELSALGTTFADIERLS